MYVKMERKKDESNYNSGIERHVELSYILVFGPSSITMDDLDETNFVLILVYLIKSID